MTRAIINLSTGRYLRGQERLRQSIQKYAPDIEFIAYQSERQISAPLHKSNPYAFKTFAFMEAFKRGYDQVIWLDSSCVLVDDIEPIWAKINEQGYIMQQAGHMVGTWTNDNALNVMNITRDEAMNMEMYGNAGFLGLDFNNYTAVEFLKKWHNASQAGLFIGNWNNDMKTESKDERCKGHRHDMSIGSIIANKLGMKYVSGNEWLHYAPPTKQPENNVYIQAQGV